MDTTATIGIASAAIAFLIYLLHRSRLHFDLFQARYDAYKLLNSASWENERANRKLTIDNVGDGFVDGTPQYLVDFWEGLNLVELLFSQSVSRIANDLERAMVRDAQLWLAIGEKREAIGVRSSEAKAAYREWIEHGAVIRSLRKQLREAVRPYLAMKATGVPIEVKIGAVLKRWWASIRRV